MMVGLPSEVLFPSLFFPSEANGTTVGLSHQALNGTQAVISEDSLRLISKIVKGTIPKDVEIDTTEYSK